MMNQLKHTAEVPGMPAMEMTKAAGPSRATCQEPDSGSRIRRSVAPVIFILGFLLGHVDIPWAISHLSPDRGWGDRRPGRWLTRQERAIARTIE